MAAHHKNQILHFRNPDGKPRKKQHICHIPGVKINTLNNNDLSILIQANIFKGATKFTAKLHTFELI